MAKRINEAKSIEYTVSIVYSRKDGKLIQDFIFSSQNSKYLTYIHDARFLVKRKVDKMLDGFLLDGFIRRIDLDNGVRMEYDNDTLPPPEIRKIQAYIPPFTGCHYCSKAEPDGLFIFCPEKNKHYAKNGGIKRCPVFRSKNEIIT